MTTADAPPVTTTTVAAGDLRPMLRAALVAADKDSHPGLMGVLLHSDTRNDKDVLVATATDRYMLAQIHIPAQGRLPHPVFLFARDVRAAATVLHGMATVALTVNETAVTIAPVNVSSEALTVPFADVMFPKNIVTLMGPFTPGSDTTIVAARLLRAAAKIARRLGAEFLHIGLSADNRPVTAHIGDRCQLLLMPSKATKYDPAAPPAFDPFPERDAS